MKIHTTTLLFVATVCYCSGTLLAAMAPAFSVDPSRLVNAIGKGDLDYVRGCVAAGLNVNQRLISGLTPLYSAVEAKRPKLVEYLLQIPGIDANIGFGERTPLINAVIKKKIGLVNIFLHHRDKVDLNLIDAFGCTALHYACSEMYANVEIFDALIEAGANPDILDPFQRKPLDQAIENFAQELEEFRMSKQYILK